MGKQQAGQMGMDWRAAKSGRRGRAPGAILISQKRSEAPEVRRLACV
jgi:hypothetical protein